jgi:hypothetical protein
MMYTIKYPEAIISASDSGAYESPQSRRKPKIASARKSRLVGCDATRMGHSLPSEYFGGNTSLAAYFAIMA